MAEQNESLESGQAVSRELRNVRYCEIIPVTRKGLKLTSWVYNTLGLNDCPAAEWEALTEEQVNEEFGSVAAKLNGPRYWVIDKLVASGSTTTGERFTFGGIEMELRAKLETRPRQGTVGEEFYVPNEVQRDTVYIYRAGRPVYELTAPDGHVYIMQSYTQVKDKSLTIADLPSLGSRLALPEGWTYATRTLAEDFELAATGLAYVINDDLYNAYQRRT
ncbi:MAG TPA: hypothetical protein VG148_07955 [Pyrinomonadaceae bacterium]|nr:hypothetical protein [Pyrinomonadaceae bacterium]